MEHVEVSEPKFGEWLRGIHASESNPHRDGMYVRTVRRTGRMNPGKFYELTDGRGDFWQYPAKSVTRIAPLPAPQIPAEAQPVACAHDYQKTADCRLPASWIDVCTKCGQEKGAAPPSAPVGVGRIEPDDAPAMPGLWFLADAYAAGWNDALAQQPAAVDGVVDFEIHAGGEYFASVGGPRERAWKEAMHYVSSLRPDDGEPEVFEVTRRKVALAAQPQGASHDDQ